LSLWHPDVFFVGFMYSQHSGTPRPELLLLEEICKKGKTVNLKKHRPFLAGLFFLCAVFPATAQVKVAVIPTTDDTVGNRLVFAIKESIRRSAGMQLVDRTQDGFIRMNIVTLDPDKSSGGGNRTIYSVVWTAQTFHRPSVTMYLTSSVGTCGTNRVSQCADGLVADTDEQASMVRGWVQDMIDKESK
jgi:hypothetical protein